MSKNRWKISIGLEEGRRIAPNCVFEIIVNRPEHLIGFDPLTGLNSSPSVQFAVVAYKLRTCEDGFALLRIL